MSIDKVKPQNTPSSSDVQNTGSGLVGPAALAGAGIGGAGGYFYLPRKMNATEVVRKFGLSREDEYKAKRGDYLAHKNDALDNIENLEQYSLETTESIKRGGRMPHSFVDKVKDFEHLKPEEKLAAGYIQELLRYRNKHVDELDKRITKVFGLDQNSKTLLQFYRKFIFKQLGKQVSLGFIMGEIGSVIISSVLHIPFVSKILMFASPAIFSASKALLMGDTQKAIGELYEQAVNKEGTIKAALDEELKKPNNEKKIYQSKSAYLKAKADTIYYKTIYEDINRAIAQQGHSLQNPARIKQEDIVKIILKAQMKIKEMVDGEVKGAMKELGKHVPKTASGRNAGLLAASGAIFMGGLALLFHPKKTKNKDGEEQTSSSTKAMQALLSAAGVAGVGAVAYTVMKKARPPKIDKALENTFDEFMKSLKGTDYKPGKNEETGRKIITCTKADGKVVHEFDEKGRRVQFTQYDTAGNKIAQYDIDPETGEQTQGTIWLQGKSNWAQRNLKFWDKHFFECNQILDKIDRKAKTRTLIYLRNTDGKIHFKEVYNMETGAKNIITYHDNKGELPKRIEEYDENNVLIRARNLDDKGNTVSIEEYDVRGHSSSKTKGEAKVEHDPDSEISLFGGLIKIKRKTKVTSAPKADGTREEITYSEHYTFLPWLCRKKQTRTLDSAGKPIGETKTEDSNVKKWIANPAKAIKKFTSKYLNPFNWFKGKDVDRNQVT